MKLNLLWLFVLLIPCLCWGQKLTTLKIEKISSKRLGIKLSYLITNKDLEMSFYKMVNDPFCDNTAALEVINTKSKKRHVYYPCNGNIDIKEVMLDDKNSIVIKTDSVYRSSFFIQFDRFLPKLTKGRMYGLRLYFNYDNIEIESPIHPYRRKLVSQEVYFTYK